MGPSAWPFLFLVWHTYGAYTVKVLFMVQVVNLQLSSYSFRGKEDTGSKGYSDFGYLFSIYKH